MLILIKDVFSLNRIKIAIVLFISLATYFKIFYLDFIYGIETLELITKLLEGLKLFITNFDISFFITSIHLESFLAVWLPLTFGGVFSYWLLELTYVEFYNFYTEKFLYINQDNSISAFKSRVQLLTKRLLFDVLIIEFSLLVIVFMVFSYLFLDDFIMGKLYNGGIFELIDINIFLLVFLPIYYFFIVSIFSFPLKLTINYLKRKKDYQDHFDPKIKSALYDI